MYLPECGLRVAAWLRNLSSWAALRTTNELTRLLRRIHLLGHWVRLLLRAWCTVSSLFVLTLLVLSLLVSALLFAALLRLRAGFTKVGEAHLVG